MHQLSVNLREKIDAPLAELCNGDLVGPRAPMPVIVRYNDDAIEEIIARILDLGGKVRHRLELIGAVAAWLPLESVERLAAFAEVKELELDQEFSIA